MEFLRYTLEKIDKWDIVVFIVGEAIGIKWTNTALIEVKSIRWSCDVEVMALERAGVNIEKITI